MRYSAKTVHRSSHTDRDAATSCLLCLRGRGCILYWRTTIQIEIYNRHIQYTCMYLPDLIYSTRVRLISEESRTYASIAR